MLLQEARHEATQQSKIGFPGASQWCFSGAMFDEFVLFCAFLVLFLVREFGSLYLFLCSLMSKRSQPCRIVDKSAGQSAVVWCYFWCVSMGARAFLCAFLVLFLVLAVTRNGFPTVSRRSGALTNSYNLTKTTAVKSCLACR